MKRKPCEAKVHRYSEACQCDPCVTYRAGGKRYIKERPILRTYILREGIRPYPSAENWDGLEVLHNGKICHTSKGVTVQIRKMLSEGCL